MADESTIIKQVQAGDTDAYASLIRTHHQKVLTFCRLLLSNPTHADDAAQDVFIKAFESLKNFNAGSSFLTWVCRIAHNHCMDLLRKKTRQKTDSLDALLETKPEETEKTLAAPRIDAGVAEKNILLQETLSRLRVDQKEILLLREMSGMTYSDIAAHLGLSVDAVKARLRRARGDLKEKARHLWALRTSNE